MEGCRPIIRFVSTVYPGKMASIDLRSPGPRQGAHPPMGSSTSNVRRWWYHQGSKTGVIARDREALLQAEPNSSRTVAIRGRSARVAAGPWNADLPGSCPSGESPVKIPNLLLALVVTAWAATVGGGVWFLWTYASRPGPSGTAAAGWPRDSALRLDPVRPMLV